jgi:hypothetical protein
MMTERIRLALEELARQIQSAGTAKLPRDLQQKQLQIWAIRWRLLLQEAGEESANDREMRRVVRLLHTMRANCTSGKESPYISALNPNETRDWRKELTEAEKLKAEILSRHRRYTEVRGKLGELELFLAQGDPKSEEDERRLHHLIRDCAKYENQRGELADMLAPYREILPAEFGFLWVKAPIDEAPVHRAKLSNYDIACRILRRLVQNRKISEGYIPTEMITLGFEGADRGRAKEAVALLVRAGVLLSKKNGATISLAHHWVGQVNRFRAGEPMGNEYVDEWVAG